MNVAIRPAPSLGITIFLVNQDSNVYNTALILINMSSCLHSDNILFGVYDFMRKF